VTLLLAALALLWFAAIMLLQRLDISRSTRGVMIAVATLVYFAVVLVAVVIHKRSN
jgi:hypothetical protein